MTQWVLIVLISAIFVLLLEARLSLGTRLAVLERDIEWITASLQKWGLVPPPREDKPKQP